MMTNDHYDHHARDFVPNEFNSLPTHEADGMLGAAEQKVTAMAMTKAIREHPEIDYGDTAVIMYDGDLYIVGDYVRSLMNDEPRPLRTAGGDAR